MIEEESKVEITPTKDEIANAFTEIKDFKNVNCVIIGQGPLPTKGAANGIAFSNNERKLKSGKTAKAAPSTRGLFELYQKDIGGDLREDGNLIDWVKDGKLMINIAMTTEVGNSGAHLKQWDGFLNGVMLELAANTEQYRIPVICFGKVAQNAFRDLKLPLIAQVLFVPIMVPHPRCYNKVAKAKFMESAAFSKANNAAGSEIFKPYVKAD